MAVVRRGGDARGGREVEEDRVSVRGPSWAVIWAAGGFIVRLRKIFWKTL
jgi:hypothetical protein